VVKTIRPDTVFIPYHWPGERSANRLTHRTLDPHSKIPEYKVSACRIRKADKPAECEAGVTNRDRTSAACATVVTENR
jgi:assimilatory nitrate reductase catalytic subunit